jgi:hypothetical protein
MRYTSINYVRRDLLIRIHANILTASSEFLKNAMKPKWRTNPGVPIDLSDQDTSTVEAYFHWLYTHKLVSQGVKTYGALASLYVFGLFLMDATFQQAVLHAIIDHLETHKWAPTASNIKAVYDDTAKGDPARRLQTCQQTGVLIDPDCFLTFYSIKSGQSDLSVFCKQNRIKLFS